MVFQNPEHQFLTHSVEDELAFGLLPGDSTEASVEHLSQAFGLDHLAQLNPFRLSGGEKRRLSVAAGLLAAKHGAAPTVLLADSQTFGLDRSRHHDHAQRTGRLRRSRGSGRHHHPRSTHRRCLGNAHHHRVAGSAGMTALTIEHPSTLVEPGVLTRWNPSIKLISLFVLSVSLLFIWEPVRPALLWVVLVIVALTVGKVRPSGWR